MQRAEYFLRLVGKLAPSTMSTGYANACASTGASVASATTGVARESARECWESGAGSIATISRAAVASPAAPRHAACQQCGNDLAADERWAARDLYAYCRAHASASR